MVVLVVVVKVVCWWRWALAAVIALGVTVDAVLMLATPRLLMALAPRAFVPETVQPSDSLLILAAPCYGLLLLFGLLLLSQSPAGVLQSGCRTAEWQAGYDIREAPKFWRRMEQIAPDARYDVLDSHPPSPERAERLRRLVDELEDD